MTTQRFLLKGHCQTESPHNCGDPSFSGIWSEIEARVPILLKTFEEFQLNPSSPVSVNFAGLTSAAVMMIKVSGGNVVASVTTNQGAVQEIPVDTILVHISKTSPVTALSIAAVSGTNVNVHVFLAQAA